MEMRANCPSASHKSVAPTGRKRVPSPSVAITESHSGGFCEWGYATAEKTNCMQKCDRIFVPNIHIGVKSAFTSDVFMRTK